MAASNTHSTPSLSTSATAAANVAISVLLLRATATATATAATEAAPWAGRWIGRWPQHITHEGADVILVACGVVVAYEDAGVPAKALHAGGAAVRVAAADGRGVRPDHLGVVAGGLAEHRVGEVVGADLRGCMLRCDISQKVRA